MERVRVVENRELGGGYRLLSVESPFGPRDVRPGQFVMLRAPGRLDPLLPRAFAVFDVKNVGSGPPRAEIMYQAVGKMTGIMASLRPGDELEMLGPLGNAFRIPRGTKRALLVAGGVGLAPMVLLARALKRANRGREPERRVEPVLLLGGRTSQQIVCTDIFEALGCRVVPVTEDGSLGIRGLVTHALEEFLLETKPSADGLAVFACGPEGMLRAVAELSRRFHVACQVSLEARMACGTGICLGCVVKLQGPKRGQPRVGEGRYERVCTEGPIFDAQEVCWDESQHY